MDPSTDEDFIAAMALKEGAARLGADDAPARLTHGEAMRLVRLAAARGPAKPFPRGVLGEVIAVGRGLGADFSEDFEVRLIAEDEEGARAWGALLYQTIRAAPARDGAEGDT